MAPYPEEVDVFSAPHSRMKELVDVYSAKLTCTDFKDYAAVESLLHDLDHTFCEFKSHEQIENKYIMRKLKKRLKMLSIQDAAVCNCHSDNKLSDILALVRDGYLCTSKAERLDFGLRLQRALDDFTTSFLPHMKEEEEVFQPMLMKYFAYDELKCLKEQVIEEHSKWHTYEKATPEPTDTVEEESVIQHLPVEVLSHILSFLSPQDLLRCGQVCKRWHKVSRGPTLWREIYPCFWAHGVWDVSDIGAHEERVQTFSDAEREERTLHAIVRYLLPQIGPGVRKIVIASSQSLTSSLLRSILILCPNVSYLDISYTNILDLAFKGLKENSCCGALEHVDLSGCLHITDLALYRLADCMAGHLCEIEDLWFLSRAEEYCESMCAWHRDGVLCHLAQLSLQCPYSLVGASSIRKTTGTYLARDEQNGSIKYLDLSGCTEITDNGLRCLSESGVLRELQYLDVSGCWLLTGAGLKALADSVPLLRPEHLYYCDRIPDGPYPCTANGCQNLENDTRACCCNMDMGL